MVHTHPGTEAFYVLEGQLSFRTPAGVDVVDAGKTLAGVAPDTPMEASSTGTADLHELIMFVVDPAKPSHRRPRSSQAVGSTVILR